MICWRLVVIRREMVTCCLFNIPSRLLPCGRVIRYVYGVGMSVQSAIRCFIQSDDAVITCGEDASVCIWSANVAADKNGKSGGEERKRLSKAKGGRNAYKSL